MDRGRLLAVAPVAEPGGAETTLLRPLRALGARGRSVTLTVPVKPGDSAGTVAA